MSTPAKDVPMTGGITLAWIDALAEDLRKQGRAFRAGPYALTIEAQVINSGEWMPITLEGGQGGACFFPDVGARDAVLAAIQQRVYAVREVEGENTKLSGAQRPL